MTGSEYTPSFISLSAGKKMEKAMNVFRYLLKDEDPYKLG